MMRPRARLPLLAGFVLAFLSAPAWAQSVTIDTGNDPSARLEVRTVNLPGGEERTFYVISAERVEVRQDELLIVASRVEFEPTAGTVRIVGAGRVERPGEVLIGDDMLVELEGGRLDSESVIVITDAVYVVGESAQRVEGRISVMNGRLAPCARCGQEVEDYAFRAERIEILPGDRLIAWDATLLIRDNPVLGFPLLVLPIAEPSRTPRLLIERGTEEKRAEVRLDWPYVSSPNAYGTFSARFLMRIDPEVGSIFESSLFGGRPERLDLAGEVDHRFFDDRGAGRVTFAYVPELRDAEGEVSGEETVRFEARYDTDAASGDPRLSWRVTRDDVARPELLEIDGSSSASLATFRATLRTRLAIPLSATATTTPSWDGRSAARSIPLALQLAGGEATEFRIGSLLLDEIDVDAGFYEDSPDPTNRSALQRSTLTTGRLQASHRLTLERVRLLDAIEISGRNLFRGRYYATGERQIAWSTSFDATARAGSIATLSASWRRDVAEGETPFAFDRIALRTRSDLTARLSITPARGYSLTGTGGWVFNDDRNPELEGWTPTVVTLEAFGDVRALAFTAVHRADPRIEDLGTLEVAATLQYPDDPIVARVSGRHLLDLDVTLPEADQDRDPNDASQGSGEIQLGYTSVAVGGISTGWSVDRLAESEEDVFRWSLTTVTATLGTERRSDAIPSLEARWTFDPEVDELAETSRVAYTATADLGDVRFELVESYGPEDGPVGTHRFSVTWADWLTASLEGVEVVQGEWLGLPADPDASRPLALSVADAGGFSGFAFRARYRTTRVPVDATTWELRGTGFEANVRLAERSMLRDQLQFLVDAYADVPLPDDVQPDWYVRRANLTVGLDVFSRVGLQGTFGYRGVYDLTTEEVTSGRLSFEQVALTVEATPELYLGAVLADVWEIIEEDPDPGFAFDPRPTLFLAYDRCCWALYTRWDTRTGEWTFTLGQPGTRAGRVFTFEDGPAIPWGDEESP